MKGQTVNATRIKILTIVAAPLRAQIADQALNNETQSSTSFATRLMRRGIEQMRSDLTEAVNLATQGE